MTNVTATGTRPRQTSEIGNSNSCNSSNCDSSDAQGLTCGGSSPRLTAILAPPNPPSQRRRVAAHIDQVLSRKSLHLCSTAVAKRILAHVASSKRKGSCPSYPENMPSAGIKAARAGPIGGGISGIPSHAQCLLPGDPSSPVSGRPKSWSVNPHSRRGDSGCASSQLTTEKPLASSSGGALTITINLAEPVLFLQGFAADEHRDRAPAILRGSLVVRATKPTKIKTITLTFRGRARTEWPEGIPPKKSEFFEEKEIATHPWQFFNAQSLTAELGHCADSFRLFRPGTSETNLAIASSTIGSLARSASPIGVSLASSYSRHERRLSLQLTPSRNLGKGDSPSMPPQGSVAQKGYRIFQPGDYIYNFELPIGGILPETIETELGSVKYELEAVVERSGAFRPKLVGKKEVLLVRCPSETSLEGTEPIAISRAWEDQLYYDIVISGKCFPLGSTVPIAFKLTPLAKVRCHRIKVYITENVEYMCKDQKVHRVDPIKKVLLLEKRADGSVIYPFDGSSVKTISGGWSGVGEAAESGGSQSPTPRQRDNILGPLSSDYDTGPTEMEFNVKLPGCHAKEKERIHFDTTHKDIQVHHWIKVVMRLSKADSVDPTKRRHFEISIDSPFHILSCRATQANTTLPAYTEPRFSTAVSLTPCSCPKPSRRNSPRENQTPTLYSVGRVPSIYSNPIPRPMHLIRRPSHNPPPFDADCSPPPLMTPPPQYESIMPNAEEALVEYFSRLGVAEEEGEDTDEEASSSGRSVSEDGVMGTVVRPRGLSLPVTPGGRPAARSMDEPRRWEPIVS